MAAVLIAIQVSQNLQINVLHKILCKYKLNKKDVIGCYVLVANSCHIDLEVGQRVIIPLILKSCLSLNLIEFKTEQN